VKDAVPNFEDYDKRNKNITKRPSGRVRIPELRGNRRQGSTGDDVKGFEDNMLLLNPSVIQYWPWARFSQHMVILTANHSDDLRHDFPASPPPCWPSAKRTAWRCYLQGKTAAGKFILHLLPLHAELTTRLESLFHQWFWSRTIAAELPQILSSRFCDWHKIAIFHWLSSLRWINMVCIPHSLPHFKLANLLQSVTAVSSGAVLWALNLENGPERKAYSSYGFLRTELYQPNLVPGYRQAKPIIDEFDDQPYVKVIDYWCSR